MSDKYDYKYEKYIVDPTPYMALDGSYHATMEDVERANSVYWDNIMNFITYPEQDIPLTPSQLKQIELNPSSASIVSVLHQIMQQQFSEQNEMECIDKKLK